MMVIEPVKPSRRRTAAAAKPASEAPTITMRPLRRKVSTAVAMMPGAVRCDGTAAAKEGSAPDAGPGFGDTVSAASGLADPVDPDRLHGAGGRGPQDPLALVIIGIRVVHQHFIAPHPEDAGAR